MDTNNKYFLPASVLVAGLLIAGAVMWDGSNSTGSTTGGDQPAKGGFGNAASIDKLTATIKGIDAKKVAADVKANAVAYQQAMDADKAQGIKVGVQSTPSSFVGNQLIVGAYPYPIFKKAIDTPFITGKEASKFSIKDINTDGLPFIGKADAPVTIVFWGDFQCVYCKSFETGGVPQITTPAALPEIVKNYVETGKVKVVFMDFAFLGEDSITAAIYSRSVWKLYPGRYFAWRTAMYEAQDGSNNSK